MARFASSVRCAIVETTALFPLLLTLLVPPTAHAAEYERLAFDGNLLVALEGTPEALDAAESALKAARQTLSAAPRVERLFEIDLPAQSGARAAAPPGTRRRWLLVSPSEQPGALALKAVQEANPWDTAHDVAIGRPALPYQTFYSALPSPPKVRVVTVEPDVHYVDLTLTAAMNRQTEQLQAADCKQPATPGTLNICRGPDSPWPYPGRFAWHLEPGFSQLAEARDSVPEPSDTDRVTVAHLDTGYDPNSNGTLPPHFDYGNSHDFTLGPNDGKPQGCGEDTGDNNFPFDNRSHGTGTLGILAAGEVEVQYNGSTVFKGRLGGVPQARVVEFRVSGTVANLRTGPMAWAIAYSADTGVDVISMSMGAVPSQILVDAVNKAYEQGTAVVAAAGNFFVLPMLGIHTPTGTVPPAYFNRVLSATGVTSDGFSYARAPCFLSFLCGRFWSKQMRGSYGPRFAMEEAIASYTPNIPWIEFARDKIPPGQIRLNGDGTSAATPQVAAAVALWLQKHRSDFNATEWRSWRKVQAAFDAVWVSAKPSARSPWYRKKYFGAGILQAADALKREIPCFLEPRREAQIGFSWVDFILSVVGPAGMGPAMLGVSEQEQRILHQTMFKSELAQLVFASQRLQDLLGGLQSDDLGDDAARRREFLEAVRDEKACSQRLRAAIDQALASGS